MIDDNILQLLDGSKTLLRDKNKVIPTLFKLVIQKGQEVLWMYL